MNMAFIDNNEVTCFHVACIGDKKNDNDESWMKQNKLLENWKLAAKVCWAQLVQLEDP